MMHMVTEGTSMFDCFWIIKPSENFRHRKTHLYLKVNAFSDFGNYYNFLINNSRIAVLFIANYSTRICLLG